MLFLGILDGAFNLAGQFGMDMHADDYRKTHQGRKHKSGQYSRDEKLRYGSFCQNTVGYKSNTRRDHDAKSSASGNRADGKSRIVAAFCHGSNGDPSDRGSCCRR